MRAFFFVVVFSFGSAEATSLVQRLRQAPGFECTSLPEVELCIAASVRTSDFRYSKAIAVLIPSGDQKVFRPKNLVLYFQGFRGVCRLRDGSSDVNADPRQTLEAFDLISQFVRSTQESGNSNSILVFPISMGKNVDYHREILSQFSAFERWAARTFQARDDYRLFVAGHSGAGSVLSRSLVRTHFSSSTLSRIVSISLLDATYGMAQMGSARLREWQQIARRNPQLTVQSVYKRASSTAVGSRNLKSTLDRQADIEGTGTSHCAIPNRFFSRWLAAHLPSRNKIQSYQILTKLDEERSETGLQN